uniref:Uncharacterized protein n=1 Tax=Arundo donax TaxID=35708 RepID=A0A0A9DH16_ARUDO
MLAPKLVNPILLILFKYIISSKYIVAHENTSLCHGLEYPCLCLFGLIFLYRTIYNSKCDEVIFLNYGLTHPIKEK